jgi:hypothetical protein
MDAIDQLRLVGLAIYGPDWQRPIARALGPLHPRPRDALDDRLVRRWISRERPAPRWLTTALISLLRQTAQLRRAEAANYEQLAEQLSP